ncbi:MAG: glycosyltransferase family 39 protein [Candidatus Omnitrophota bacterium]
MKRTPKIDDKTRLDNKVCLFLFLIIASVLILFSNGHYGGDGLETYLTAESIVLDGDLFIHDRPFEVEQMRYRKRGFVLDEGKFYTRQGLGVVLLLVPFYLLGHTISGFFSSIPRGYITQFFVSLSNPFILALLGVFLFKLLRAFGFKPKTSLYAVIIYSFCTMNIIYARSGFAEPAVALCLTLAVLYLLRYKDSGSIAYLFISALFLGYTIFIKKNSLLYLPSFTLYLVYLIKTHGAREKKALYIIKSGFAFLIPFAFYALIILLQNYILYGSMASTEFGSVSDMLSKTESGGQAMKGVYYYLISSGKGYFIFNLVFIPALFGIAGVFRKRKDTAIFIISLLLFNFIFYVRIFVRGTLFSWGPRYLFPTLPLMAIFLAMFIAGSNTLKRKITIAFFAAAGFLIQLPALFVSFSKFIFFVKEKLHLDEYMINFMPELSPIRGSWFLLVSSMHNKLTGKALEFVFNPDTKFVQPIKESLAGFDTLDTWWANMLKVAPDMLCPVLLFVVLLLFIIIISSFKIRSILTRAEGTE